MQNQAVLVLNADYGVINIVNWRRALALVLKGRAEIVENSDKIIRNFEDTVRFTIPSVIRLVNFVKSIYKAKVSFNKVNVFIRDKYTCLYCGAKEQLTIDHVQPVSRGGKTCFENCATCCKSCNIVKGSKELKDTKLSLKYKPYQPSYIQYLQSKIEIFGLDKLSKELKE